MPSSPPPSCLALLICDSVVTDRATGKISILGMFSDILTDGVPVLVPQLTVYAELTNGHGETAVLVRLSRAKPERVEGTDDVLGQTLAAWEFQIAFADPTRIYSLNVMVAKLHLPDFGAYRFSVEVDGTSIMERSFSVASRT